MTISRFQPERHNTKHQWLISECFLNNISAAEAYADVRRPTIIHTAGHNHCLNNNGESLWPSQSPADHGDVAVSRTAMKLCK